MSSIDEQLSKVNTKDDMIKLLANWYYTHMRKLYGKEQAAAETKLIKDKADKLMAEDGG